jgi:tRNA(Ile)-lysidine synthase
VNLPLAERVRESLAASGVEPEAPLLVGFSGGRDSVVLLELLLQAGWKHLTLCHLDHGLRPESAGDAAWAERCALERGLAFRGQRVDVAGAALARRIGLEEAAREMRYEFFSRIADQVGCSRVVLGHHADDQVETFVFRLLRGSGSSGLGGMSPVSCREEGKLVLLRPMLAIWRREINALVELAQISFREDVSNADPRWTRNRIRHEMLPAMERIMQRPVAEALWRAAELFRAEAAWMDAMDPTPEAVDRELRVGDLRGVPLAVRRRRVLRWLRGQGVCGIGFNEVERVLGLLGRIQPARVNLPGGIFARRRGGRIFLEGP